MESILTSVKKTLGITEDYTHFDIDLIMHINTAISILTQIGVGPPEGFLINGPDSKWSDWIPEDPLLSSVKSYVYLKVRLLFDPPSGSPAIESIKRLIDELEWRIHFSVDPSNNKKVEEIQNG
ncbi:hypothetical protein [Eubacterium sp.]|uniref:phage head-tail connector protein n=1 Tax=Eubacterium sp. TaxID=142586 RepID=UPI0030D95635